ncbi:hypothetical protein [Leptolyngbya sp. FACHB-261]|uniref:hypothetical protein n=1 Tax=Leptolyngbya sp. FACHB-261 TaxID=2692806 RepID=UPI00168300F9|nr:hypothetical protein [Leptolyngbya sp. FACHB-261]MBD2101884.1 hypothetical protein [Leptolyngbya sp. FACHB-261]
MFTPTLIKSDLSPGDILKSTTRDWSDLVVHCLESTDNPRFELAYDQLWAEFGQQHEMEQRETLSSRFQWQPQQRRRGYALLYQMLLLSLKDEFVGVRDHTAIADENQVVVHLSHALVSPQWRRTGIAGWLRALPLQTARECLKRAGLPPLPITLVAEMEPLHLDHPGRLVRLLAYEKAGFQKIALPIAYAQPDFRPFAEIDATGPQPRPLSLIVRRVGREHESTITSAEVQSLVRALYEMYATEFRSQDMAELFAQLDCYPPASTPVPLVAPSQPE